MTPTEYALYGCIIIIAFAITVAILRWAFGINKMLRKQEALLKTLQEIAKKQGVDPAIAESIYKASEGEQN
jgi:hypothetical protein